jgi:hypothetical protein
MGERTTARDQVARAALVAQGAYYVATGVWPILHMCSFEAVTGPKRDHWLVKTVGAVIAAVGASLLVGARRRRPSVETLALAAGSAAALGAIDVVYSAKGTISPIYLLDAAAEAVLVAPLALARQRGGDRSPEDRNAPR